MEFELISIACFLTGFIAQLILLLKTKKLLPRLSPAIFVLLSGAYSLLRMFGIIRYRNDGIGFFDVGALTGLVLTIFAAILAAGCVGGAAGYLVIRLIKKLRARSAADREAV